MTVCLRRRHEVLLLLLLSNARWMFVGLRRRRKVLLLLLLSRTFNGHRVMLNRAPEGVVSTGTVMAVVPRRLRMSSARLVVLAPLALFEVDRHDEPDAESLSFVEPEFFPESFGIPTDLRQAGFVEIAPRDPQNSQMYLSEIKMVHPVGHGEIFEPSDAVLVQSHATQLVRVES